MAAIKGECNWYKCLGKDGVLEFDRAMAASRDLPESYVTADPDPIKLDDVTILIKTMDGDIMTTMPLTMNLEQSTYLQRLKAAYYASYGELKDDGKYRYRFSIADLIDKANLELKYIWE